MNVIQNSALTHQSEYAKKLRPMLPPAAFLPDRNKIVILLINVALLVLGWAIASYLDRWTWYWLPLYFPLALLMGNSVIVLLFSSHDLMHSSAIKAPRFRRIVSLVGLAMLWMPPTLWQIVHNREHHTHTNSVADPDRNYLYEQPNTWGKWIQNQFSPSSDVHPLGLAVGMATAWGIYTFRNLTSVLLFNNESVNYVPAAFRVSPKERAAIASEFFGILGLHLSILCYLQFHPLKLALSYFLPIGIGYAGIIFYVYTNHMLCRLTSVNDPLANSISIKVPKLFDLLHLNFSYHTEHHIFPGINSDYYPLVQTLLQTHYPTKAGYVLPAKAAWQLLLQTPRHYRDDVTFTTWSGETSIPCPLEQNAQKIDPTPIAELRKV
ncbi:fatty acid desaturase family protein [Myxacorys almedinensis]|uniref:Fatty acid desaturase n=1 Tax=Myxacorys almedinensis A TaxID=2690445 RepID=A0A8J7Z3K2_9CYAN|nr:fatty acid desaturase [Myxacorys almedinensis]NDJ17483.1 fatty acid desaturase [Myxacorys almedinensis A]